MITTQFTRLQSISIPLNQADHTLALQFAQSQPTKEKQKQIYVNTLSVLVVKHYLDILGIQSDFASSNIAQPFQRLTADIADLKVVDPRLGQKGQIECRHLMQDEANIYIPMEAWEDRIAYVFVQFDLSYREGLILGFLPTVSHERIPITQLQSLTQFLEFLYEPQIQWVNFRDWLNHQFAESWTSLEEIVKSSDFKPQLTFRFASAGIHWRAGLQKRIKNLDASINLDSPINDICNIIKTTENEQTLWEAVEILRLIEPEHSATGVRRTHDLQSYLDSPVALTVNIVEKSQQKIAVLLRVDPLGIENTLPPQLTLSLFEGTDQLLKEVITGSLDIRIQLKFIADIGEKFVVKLSLEDKIFTEYFAV